MRKKYDKILLLAVLALLVFGVIMIYSASSVWAEYKFNDSFHYVKQQALFIVIGLILMNIVGKLNYKFYYEKANLIITICLILLILVIIPGIGSIRNGSRSWFGIGPFGIQPSEFAKLGLIIFTSKYLCRSNKFLKSYKTGVFPILGIVFLFFAIGLVGIIVLILIAPYRMDRITSFVNPWKDPLGTGFQIIQSLYAIGPGGLLGRGFGNSIQKHFYLPEPQTDFIFSIITEEFGIVGAFIVIGLFIVILQRGIKISLEARDQFSKYLAFGMTFQIIFQAMLNLMVVSGMIPVTGVTLPFLSYGGSSLLITMISIGILLNISKNNN